MLRNNYLYTENCLFILDESPDLCEKILSEYSFFCQATSNLTLRLYDRLAIQPFTTGILIHSDSIHSCIEYVLNR